MSPSAINIAMAPLFLSILQLTIHCNQTDTFPQGFFRLRLAIFRLIFLKREPTETPDRESLI
jgi:hypothetical protein